MNRRSNWKRVGMMGLVLLLLLSLLGCEQNRQDGEEETEGMSELQVKRIQQALCPRNAQEFQEQYLAISDNSFECTDTGVYFLCRDIQGDSFLLYGDHGSGYAGETLRQAGLRPYEPGLQRILFHNGNKYLLL